MALVFDGRNASVFSPVEILGKGKKIDIEITSGSRGAILRNHQIARLELGECQIGVLEHFQNFHIRKRPYMIQAHRPRDILPLIVSSDHFKVLAESLRSHFPLFGRFVLFRKVSFVLTESSHARDIDSEFCSLKG